MSDENFKGLSQLVDQLQKPYAVVGAIASTFAFVGGFFDPKDPASAGARIFFLILFAIILYGLVVWYSAPYKSGFARLVAAVFAGGSIVIVTTIFLMTVLALNAGYQASYVNADLTGGLVIACLGVIVFRFARGSVGYMVSGALVVLGEAISWAIWYERVF